MKKNPKPGKTLNQGQERGPGSEYLLAGAIALFTLMLYLPSLKNGFVDWDDTGYLRDNLAIHRLGWVQLKNIFTTFYSGNYHPLTTLSFALEYAVSGFRSATLYHFDNLLLHLVNVLLVYRFVRLISPERYVAAIVALWFGIHPMHVESVAWISERKDLLYTAFFMAGLICYGYYLRVSAGTPGKKGEMPASRRRYYLLSMFFLLLSLLSKSAAVIFPLVMLLMDFLEKRKFSVRQISEKIPFFVLALVFGIVAILSQGSAIHRGLDLDLGTVNRFFTVNYAIFRYISMMFFPAGLSAYHPYPGAGQGSEGTLIYLSVLFNLAIVTAAAWSLKYSRKYFAGFLFFLVNLILVLQILPVGGAFMAERYTYVPYIGLFFIVATRFTGVLAKPGISSSLKTLLYAVFILFCVFFSMTSWQRIGVWKDSFTLFDNVVLRYPGNHLAWYLRASARENSDVTGKIADYSKSVALKSANPDAYNNLGNIYSAAGKYPEALENYNMALKYDTTLAEALNNRGAVKAIGGDLPGALLDINRALAVKPAYKDAYRNRGLVRLRMNKLSAARDDWKIAVELGDEPSVNLLEKYSR